MIKGEDFIAASAALGFDFYTSVPCSYLTPLLNGVLANSSLDHFAASSEGEAIGIAAGAYLAGRSPVVMMQNSGLGNAVNPLSSLNHVFGIPSLLIISWRGSPGVPDEPQHSLMGEVMHDLLDVLKIPHAPFPRTVSEILPTLIRAQQYMQTNERPFALVVDPGVVEEERLQARAIVRPPEAVHRKLGNSSSPLPTRAEVLGLVRSVAPSEAALIATTGKTGRELYALGDDARNMYVVGSMGCASAIGLGIALNSERPVIVLDGDGAALMKLGNLSTIGRYRPPSLVHLVIDNGMHDSTGGQPTNSGNVDFSAVAAACGYANTYSCQGLDVVSEVLKSALAEVGPHLIHVPVRAGTMANLPRPSVTPEHVARRFARHIQAAVERSYSESSSIN